MEWNIYCTKYVYVLFGLGFEKYTFEKYDMKNINETKKKKKIMYSTVQIWTKNLTIKEQLYMLRYFFYYISMKKKNCYVFKQNTLQVNEWDEV